MNKNGSIQFLSSLSIRNNFTVIFAYHYHIAEPVYSGHPWDSNGGSYEEMAHIHRLEYAIDLLGLSILTVRERWSVYTGWSML